MEGSRKSKTITVYKTEEFSKYARFRNGVEAIPALLRVCESFSVNKDLKGLL